MRRVARDRRMEVHPGRARKNVPLPSQHHHGEPLPQQQCIAVVGGRVRRRRAIGAEVEDADGHPAAVHHVDERHAAAARCVHGTQHHEFRPGLDLALRIARCATQVDDLPVVRIRRIEREEHAPRQALVRTGGPEREATRERLARVDDDTHDVRERQRGEKSNAAIVKTIAAMMLRAVVELPGAFTREATCTQRSAR